MTPRLVLVCGLPGAGKTTAARDVAVDLSAVRLCGDEWMADLGIDLFDEQTRDRLEVAFWKLAQQLLRLGTSVVLESGFWLRADRDEKREGAHALGAAVELLWLDVPLEERGHRIQQRNDEAAHGVVAIRWEQLANWERFFQRPDDDELALFDKVQVVRPGRR